MLLINHAVVVIALAAVVVAQSVQAFNASESLWKQYATLYPKGLNLIFRAEETLQEAHNQANVDHANTRKLGCTDYNTGRELGK